MLGEDLVVGHGLRPLVLVVGELQILPTAVQVEPLAEQVERHHHALGVPPGPAQAPRRLPARLALLGLLPEREVQRGPLVLVRLDPCPRLQRIERLLREQAVPVHLGDLQVDTVRRLVGRAPVHQLAHQRHHVVDVLRGVRNVVRAQIAQGGHGLPPAVLEFGGHVGFGAA